MSNISWTPNLEVGDSEIDHHHQELFKLVSMMDSAIAENSNDALEKIVLFLEHYVVDHFDAEEALMQSTKYPDYEFHKGEHAIFKARIQNIRTDFEKKDTPKVMYNVRLFVDKMIEHIQTVDVRMAGLAKH